MLVSSVQELQMRDTKQSGSSLQPPRLSDADLPLQFTQRWNFERQVWECVQVWVWEEGGEGLGEGEGLLWRNDLILGWEGKKKNNSWKREVEGYVCACEFFFFFSKSLSKSKPQPKCTSARPEKPLTLSANVQDEIQTNFLLSFFPPFI